MPIVNLTEKFISTELICPSNKRVIEYVTNDRSGLYISVSASNQKTGTFYLRYKNPNTGKTSHIKLGRTSDISLDDARKKVAEYRSQIAQGVDQKWSH